MNPQLVILDFGSQYTQLIARAVRELGVYCEIHPGTADAEIILAREPSAIILSGGPSSVTGEDSLRVAPEVLHAGLPLFGICYGMQLIVDEFGGTISGWGRSAGGTETSGSNNTSGGIREFGPAKVRIISSESLFAKLKGHNEFEAWMSHGDKVTQLPDGFEAIAESDGAPVAAFACDSQKLYGVQFHPEVHHTPLGKDILGAFLFEAAGLTQDWNSDGFIKESIDRIKATVPTGNVVCGLSGGVDSTVAAKLVSDAIGDRLYCIFVDHGLLREGEAEEVMEEMHKLGLHVTKVDAQEAFLSELCGVSDPEKKRKIIGRVFIEVFEKEAQRISDVQYLVQGTLYPDVIESVSVVGKSATIKSHHNVGGLTDDMKLKLIEPLRELFKDEVRSIGRDLGIPERYVMRQPFPGPGLAIRCLGEITPERLSKLRKANKIVCDEVEAAELHNDVIWQYLAVLLPVQSVGVMGDGRTYDEAIAIRAVTSRDGMTADWFYFDQDILRRLSSRIVNEVEGVNRVVLDISSKPPSTIEWE